MPVPPLSDIDIKLLRVFRAVVDCGGFGRAQIELGLARSTISTHMASLETRLGMKLCRRGRGGFALTERGRLVYKATLRFLSALEGFRAEIGELSEKIVGEVKIGVIDNLIMDRECALHTAIACFARQAPEVHLTVQVISPNQTEKWLTGGQLHLALVPEIIQSSTIRMEPLFLERQELYCGRGHDLFELDETQITKKLVAKQAYARRGYSITTPYESLFRGPAAATAFHMEGIAHLILSGQFLGYLPHAYAQHWVVTRQLRPILPEELNFEVQICLARSTQASLSFSADVFRKVILKAHIC